jgi:hypothetical protein
MGEQVHQVAELQGLIERSPAATLAAVEMLGLILLAALWVRALLRVEKVQRTHAKATAQLQDDHRARVDSIRMSELERAVKLEHLVQGVLRMVEVGTVEVVRGRRKRKPTTAPGLAMEPDAPTLSFPLGGGEEPEDE